MTLSQPTHTYNTRYKKNLCSPVVKHGGRGPPTQLPPPKDNPPQQEDTETVTVYLEDVIKGINRKQEMSKKLEMDNMITMVTLLTAMANKELSAKHRAEEIRRKRKEQKQKKRKKSEPQIVEIEQLETNPDSFNEEEIEESAKQNEIEFNKIISGESDNQEDEDSEGISFEELLKRAEELENIVTDSDSDSDSDEEYDKFDEEYCELWEDETMDMENTEWQHFYHLEKEDKEKFLTDFKMIKDLTKTKPIRFKILESPLPNEIKSIAMQKVMGLNKMDNSSGEYFKSEQWLNTLMDIPFGKYNKFPVDYNSPKKEISDFLGNLSKEMTNAIYGHNEAKCQILQLVGQSIKNPESAGNVLAIQGPMGNGKTTLVKEGIAKALGRPFAFIALGGATDSSYFDGHCFTYEGSRWGKIVDILIQSKCMNPIIYFDELDKISETSKGLEIVHLLTHLTDSSQNNSFNDNYFTGVDFDLSKALFIFSFNDESKVDSILKDRMNVINTDGFNNKEKRKITREYLLPGIYKEYNLKKEDIVFEDDIINNIIENYTTNEKGVRNLKRCLYNIVSKINIWTMLSEEDKKDLPFKLNNVDFPYTVTTDTCSTLLKFNKSGAPIGMYL